MARYSGHSKVFLEWRRLEAPVMFQINIPCRITNPGRRVACWGLAILTAITAAPSIQAQPTFTYLPERSGSAQRIALSSHGDMVAASSKWDATRVWLNGKVRHALPGHVAAISPDDRWIVTGTEFVQARRGELRIIDAVTGALVVELGTPAIRVLEINGDSTRVLVGGHQGEVQVVSLPHGDVLHSWQATGHWMTSLDMSPDNRWVAASSTKAGHVWNTETSEMKIFAGHNSWVDRIILDPGLDWVLTSSFDGTARLHDFDTGETLAVLDHGSRINVVDVHADSLVAVTGGSEGKVHIWQLLTGERLHTIQTGDEPIRSLDISPDGQQVAIGASEPSSALFDLPSGQRVRSLRDGAFASFVRFSADGRRLAVASGSRVHLLDPASDGPAEVSLSSPCVSRPNLDFSADGRFLMNTRGIYGTAVWDLTSAKAPLRMAGARTLWTGATSHLLLGGELPRNNPCGCCKGTAAETSLAESDYTLWDAESGHRLAIVGPGTEARLAVSSSDGSVLATAHPGGEVKLWSGADGHPLATLSGLPKVPRRLAMTADGRIVAAGDQDGNVAVWRDRRSTPRRTLQHDNARTTAHLTFVPDSQVLMAIPSQAKALRFWDLTSNTHRDIPKSLEEPLLDLEFLPGSQDLVLGKYGRAEVEIWSREGRRRHTLKGHLGDLNAIAVDPKRRRVAAAGKDLSVRLWDTATGQAVRVFRGLTTVAERLAFDPNGRLLAAATKDGTVMLWDVPTSRLLARLIILPNEDWAVIGSDGTWDASNDGRVEELTVWVDDRPESLANVPRQRRRGLLHQVLTAAQEADARETPPGQTLEKPMEP